MKSAQEVAKSIVKLLGKDGAVSQCNRQIQTCKDRPDALRWYSSVKRHVQKT